MKKKEASKDSSNSWWNLLKYHKYKFLSWLFGIVSAWMGIADFAFKKEEIYNIKMGTLVVIIPMIIAGVFQAINFRSEKKRDKSMQELNKALKDFNAIKGAIPIIIRNFVIAIYENLNLSEKDRITLYLPGDEMFNPCVRYSRNPNIRSIKRTQYRQGVIKKVWENDWWFDNNFPDPSQMKEYKKYQRTQYGLTYNEVAQLSMKAVLYCGKRISNSSGREPTAILIIESTNRNSFTESEIKDKLEGEVDRLVPLLENETIKSCIPNQAIIDEEEGF